MFVELSILLQIHAAAPDFDRFEDSVATQMRDETAPALALGLWSADTGFLTESYGIADMDSARAVTDQDVFRSASTLKMVVAAAIVRHCIETGCSLHTPIGDVAPELAEPFHPLTLHQLLTHTGGLIDQTDDYGRLDEDALRDSMLSLPDDIVFLAPDTAFSYSNVGYNLAGYVLERLTDEPFAVALERLILSPTGMTRSTFDTAHAQAIGWAAPHWRGELFTNNPENAAEWPSGMMYTSAGDQARFLAALLNDGMINDQRVWPEGLAAQLTHPHVSADDTATGFGYGYGVMIGTFNGEPAWFHSGGLPGYRANVLALPDRQIAVALLANGEGFDRNTLLDALFPQAEADQTGTTPDLAPVNATELAGHYVQRDGLPSLCITSSNGQAFITSRGQQLELLAAPNNELIGVDDTGERRARYRLHRNDDGQILAMSSWVRAFRFTGEACAD